MKSLLILAAIIMLAFRVNASVYLIKLDSGNNYYVAADRSYTWREAIQECFKLNASLVAVESNDKQQEINYALKDYISDDELVQLRLWTAGNDNDKEGDFNWITNGKSFEFTNWASKEPNNAGVNENCVELRPNDFLWNDVTCSIKLGFICEENKFLRMATDACIKQHLSELQELKESHENELNILVESHKQQLEDKDKELGNLKKSHQADLSIAKQKNKDELEAVKKFHIQIMDDNKNALDMLNKSHENATRLLLQEKNNELEEIKKSNALELTKTLEIQEKLCDNKTSNLIEQKIQKLFEQKLQEIEELKRNYEEANLLELTNLRNAHEDELNQLRQTKEQELEALRNTCDKVEKKLIDEKNLEIASWQKINELQMNRTLSYKFYNFVFHGNNNR